MNVLLVSLLLQAPSPEQVLQKIEQKVLGAKTVAVQLSGKHQPPYGDRDEDFTGAVLLGEGNRCLVKVEHRSSAPGGDPAWESATTIRSDGSRLLTEWRPSGGILVSRGGSAPSSL